MLKREITYMDFDDNPQTDTYYFHLSRTELTEMEANVDAQGGMIAYLKRIVETQDTKTMFQIFKDIVVKSVGVKSDNGKQFVKDPEFAKQFVYSAAFDALFMDLASDSQKAADFIIALLPKDLGEKVAAQDILKAVAQEEAPVAEKAE